MSTERDLMREEFEAWHMSKFATNRTTGQPTRDMHNGVYSDEYGPKEHQERWDALQAARQQAVVVPSGWVMVPVECTAAMELAYDDKCEEDKEYEAGLYRPAYEAMLAAAPQADHASVECTCGDIYPANSYGAGFIAGSGMCEECDAALPAKDVSPAPDVSGLVEALEEIVNPVKFMRLRLKQDERLDGFYANVLSADPRYLKQIAARALQSHQNREG